LNHFGRSLGDIGSEVRWCDVDLHHLQLELWRIRLVHLRSSSTNSFFFFYLDTTIISIILPSIVHFLDVISAHVTHKDFWKSKPQILIKILFVVVLLLTSSFGDWQKRRKTNPTFSYEISGFCVNQTIYLL
jgi:hypothetical protein